MEDNKKEVEKQEQNVDNSNETSEDISKLDGISPEGGLVDGHHYGGVKEIDLAKEMKTSFLSYAMSVLVSRALPDVRDAILVISLRISLTLSASKV